MQIRRVQVEEGFLDGLDVSFVPGLNVVIGARGTGKTSLIELVRFCLGVQGYTSESRKRSLEHALSVLGSGQVTVTLSDGERESIVTRTADEETPRTLGAFVRPIVFSQTEIETVGLEAQGRVRLLDSFTRDQTESNEREAAACSEVRSLTAEVGAQRRQIDKLSGLVVDIPSIDEQIAALLPQEQEVARASTDARERADQLEAISTQIAQASVRVGEIERFRQSVASWRSRASASLAAKPVFESDLEGVDGLANSRARVERANKYLTKAIQELESALSETESVAQASQNAKIELEGRARGLRKEIEALRAGAGAIARQGQQLRERKAQLESLAKLRKERRAALKRPLADRDAALELLDSIRERRFQRRTAVAIKLTGTLGPRIRVHVSRAGQFDAFAAAIADALRGSGLRYSELSTTLAGSVSPRELLEAVDQNDYELLADVTGITESRAARVLARLRECDLGALATVAVDDTVRLELLDGVEYKGIRELSTGQRCTVVLPLVLQHRDRVLIVDQPEDHIDNAFIADTLIASMLAREDDGQIIVSTHNANIPVLGNADCVVQLGSDGSRGFPVLASHLDDPRVVEAISTVMEGGAEAFKKRARFYGRHAES